jgi:hypothetical protein
VVLMAAATETRYTAWQFSGSGFDAVEDHPFNNVETAGQLAVRRSYNSIAPWEESEIEINEYDPSDGEAVSEIVLDCRSNVNVDSKVDGADMGILLAEWGSSRSVADISRDGTVDGADLGLLLGAFGDCP